MPKKLEKYNKKRDFKSTNEPQGMVKEQEGDLRFVVQHHLARREHFDLRLEWKGVLLSWAVPKRPSYDTQTKRLAVKVEDHPLDYRNFEGTIPKGQYGGGTVMIWDEGLWEPHSDIGKGLREGVLKFTLKGHRLIGRWTLIRLKEDEKGKDNWLFIKERDEYAGSDDELETALTSIRTNRTMEEIEQGEEMVAPTKNPFDKADVQLAKLVTKLPSNGDWVYELKYDGYRIVSYIEGNKARLLTRNNNDYSSKFGEVANSLVRLSKGRSMVLDGEMVVVDDKGKTDFQAMQNFMRKNAKHSLSYIIFDILALDGKDLRKLPLTERKEILEEVMAGGEYPNLHFSRHIENGEEGWKAACKGGYEGLIGKKAASTYSGNRQGGWIKIKCGEGQEFIICGYTVSEKKARGISSLLLGVYENETLVYAGRAGTGLSSKSIKMLKDKFLGLEKEKTPFDNPPKEKTGEEVFWLNPKLIADIRFAEWTKDNVLRQASYKGLREDKDPKDVVRENLKREDTELEKDIQIAKKDEGDIDAQKIKQKPTPNSDSTTQKEVEEVKITSKDKVIFQDENITKGEVVDYYKKIAVRMLPYVKNRVLSVVRCPKGVNEPCFFKKHQESKGKGIGKINIPNSKGENKEYFYVTSVVGLVWEAQMGTLEFHTWGSSVKSLEKPDVMVFDLDPDEGMDLDKIRQGAKDLKSILEELSLDSYIKTSGGKGFHIVVPLKPVASWEVFYEFARKVVEVAENKWEEKYTSNIKKDKRENKIFIDWLRNSRGATSIAPYSVRARKGGKVSMPIFWEELDTAVPDGFTMKDALERLKSADPWEGFWDNNQTIR